jgi:hypothetical protein
MVYDSSCDMDSGIEIKLQHNGKNIIEYSSEIWDLEKYGFPSENYLISMINRICNVFDSL